MTVTLSPADIGTSSRLEVEFVDAKRLSLFDLHWTIRRLQDLMEVGYWVDVGPPPFHDGSSRPKSTISRQAEVALVSYQSPLQIALAIPGAAGAVFTAARGALYLMNQWQRTRTANARADLEVAAYELIKDLMPSAEEVKRAMGGEQMILLFPTESDLTDVADLIPRISRFEIVSGSATDSSPGPGT